MIQTSQHGHRVQQCFRTRYQHPLLRRHPVLVPAVLLTISVVLCITSLFGSTLFSVLALLGIPVASMCLLFALVAGISGILTGIISLIEHFDCPRLHAKMFPQIKEGT
jgi:hypothetical protein